MDRRAIAAIIVVCASFILLAIIGFGAHVVLSDYAAEPEIETKTQSVPEIVVEHSHHQEHLPTRISIHPQTPTEDEEHKRARLESIMALSGAKTEAELAHKAAPPAFLVNPSLAENDITIGGEVVPKEIFKNLSGIDTAMIESRKKTQLMPKAPAKSTWLGDLIAWPFSVIKSLFTTAYNSIAFVNRNTPTPVYYTAITVSGVYTIVKVLQTEMGWNAFIAIMDWVAPEAMRDARTVQRNGKMIARIVDNVASTFDEGPEVAIQKGFESAVKLEQAITDVVSGNVVVDSSHAELDEMVNDQLGLNLEDMIEPDIRADLYRMQHNIQLPDDPIPDPIVMPGVDVSQIGGGMIGRADIPDAINEDGIFDQNFTPLPYGPVIHGQSVNPQYRIDDTGMDDDFKGADLSNAAGAPGLFIKDHDHLEEQIAPPDAAVPSTGRTWQQFLGGFFSGPKEQAVKLGNTRGAGTASAPRIRQRIKVKDEFKDVTVNLSKHTRDCLDRYAAGDALAAAGDDEMIQVCQGVWASTDFDRSEFDKEEMVMSVEDYLNSDIPSPMVYWVCMAFHRNEDMCRNIASLKKK